MKYGVWLFRMNPGLWITASVEAEKLGYDSVWVSDHLILPAQMPGHPLSPETPVLDPLMSLAAIGVKTERIGLGTYVYNIGLRHPFVTARAVQTLDVLSSGRTRFGIGVSYIEAEWERAQLDFRTRGRRADEIIAILARLWTEDVTQHQGEFYSFGPVRFEPKPVQKPYPPIIVGGHTEPALRRAARIGDGWIPGAAALDQDFAGKVRRLNELRADQGRAQLPFEIIIAPPEPPSKEAVSGFEELGVTTIIVSPWSRTSGALEGMKRFAGEMIG